jgi:hypothetical protein
MYFKQAATWWFERDTDGEVLFKTDGLRLGGLARYETSQ